MIMVTNAHNNANTLKSFLESNKHNCMNYFLLNELNFLIKWINLLKYIQMVYQGYMQILIKCVNC